MADVQIAIIDQQNTQIALAAPSETEVTVAVPGIQGPVGEGVPSGGTTNQVLFKQSGTDYDTAWSEVTSAMIGDLEITNADVAANAEIAVSKLADGAARQLLQTDAAGTGVEWTSNVDVPGTLDVTGATTLDSTLTVPLGSAAAPTVRFTGDTNTGIYSPGADQVAVATNGTGRLFVDASGNVGIGATPNSYAGYSTLTINNTTGSELDFEVNGTLTSDIYTDSAGTYWTTRTAVPIVLRTNSTERLRITSGGLVGIGTSTPSSTLDVNGSINFASSGIVGPTNLNLSTDTTQAYYFGLIRNDQFERFNGMKVYNNANGIGGTPASRIGFFTDLTGAIASTERLTITETGKVGIGITSPAWKLDVKQSDDQNGITLRSNVNDSQLRIVNNNGNFWQITATYGSSGSYQPITFLTSDLERMRLDTSGRLLVGTSSARSNVYVGGSPTTPSIQSETSGSTYNNGASLLTYSAVNYAPILTLGTSNSDTAGTNAAVGINYVLGFINFVGNDGTNFRSGAFISAAVDGSVSTGDLPTRLVFSTTADGASSPTERMRITSDAYVRLAAGTGGIQFNGDTAAANALDDYEEGTWTPTLGGTATYNFQSATYTKVGRQVTVNCYLDVSGIGTGSTSAISGLPFAVGTFAPASGAVSRLNGSAVNVTSLQVQLSGTTVTTVGMTVAGSMATQNVFGTGAAIYFTAVYFV